MCHLKREGREGGEKKVEDSSELLHAGARSLRTGLDRVGLRVLLEVPLPALAPQLQDLLRRAEGVQDRPVEAILCG